MILCIGEKNVDNETEEYESRNNHILRNCETSPINNAIIAENFRTFTKCTKTSGKKGAKENKKLLNSFAPYKDSRRDCCRMNANVSRVKLYTLAFVKEDSFLTIAWKTIIHVAA